MLDDAIDVVSPGVAVEEAVDGEAVLFVESVEHSADASGWLTRAFGEDAVMLFPESVFVEALPDGIFFDMEDEVCFDIFELDNFWFADGWDCVAAGAHFGAVDVVAVVDDGDVADHGAAFFGEDVEFFSE